MIKTGVQRVRGVGFASVLILSTWTFFLPIAGFHHMIICGVLGPVCLDGETPRSGDLLRGEYDVKIFPDRFAVSLLLWAGCILLGFWVVRAFGRWLVETSRIHSKDNPLVASCRGHRLPFR